MAADAYRAIIASGSRLATTNYVVNELVALLTSPLRIPRPTIVSLIASITSSAHVDIIHVDATLHDDAWQMLSQRLDKTWSLVDCSSFVFMNRIGITDALTTDHHFEQAGFHRLLKTP